MRQAEAGDIDRKQAVGSGAEKEAVELADALGCSVAVMAEAKSFFPEDHTQCPVLENRSRY